jgi:hypothetical protein
LSSVSLAQSFAVDWLMDFHRHRSQLSTLTLEEEEECRALDVILRVVTAVAVALVDDVKAQIFICHHAPQIKQQ